MMKSKGTAIDYAVTIILLLIVFGFGACQRKNIHEGWLIQVDMSGECSAGRFAPDKGDKIAIAGEFNGWKPDSIFLLDHGNKRAYSVLLPLEVIKQDTLVFKFKVIAGDGRPLANKGWESIPNRRMTIHDLGSDKILALIFNEQFDKSKMVEVTFTVGTANQEVLGFFKPKEGDEVVVTGNFCNWREDGFLMMDEDDDGIYTATVPIRVIPDRPIEYKFRLLNYRKAILPNSGWETIPNRRLEVRGETDDIPYAEFNNMRRVARFLIKSEKLEKSGRFNPKNGEILQVMLILDGKEVLSEPLMRVEQHVWEVAVAIPLTTQQVGWKLIKNIAAELSEAKTVEVGLNGKIFEVDAK